ncbi:hypothetical protein GIB67_017425 [Kingdonia uniflora]|uniref:Homeobox-leucine zipper protein n=1 Tax=Kingdonia uniflora TaxID=39325 RepID=A0A7J7M4B3_9MAGN|nr:hypothetical protein GIB67_017425 [Kingdonia uniflora]
MIWICVGEPRIRKRRRKNKGEAMGVIGVTKRKLSDEQLNILEKNFGNEHKLDSQRKDRIAFELGLDPRQVAVWFQNRRARWKNKKLEEEYSRLKTAHESVIVEKCHLEAQVLDLEEKLCEAKNEIQRLSDRSETSSSPCLSGGADYNPLLGGFGVEGFDNCFYEPENNCVYGMEWVDLYSM